MTQTELEKQIFELLQTDIYTYTNGDVDLDSLFNMAHTLASLKMEGFYEKEFVEWVIEPDNVFYEDGIYCINDASMEKGITLEAAYEYWQNNVKDK
jgi:hypothetical protein